MNLSAVDAERRDEQSTATQSSSGETHTIRLWSYDMPHIAHTPHEPPPGPRVASLPNCNATPALSWALARRKPRRSPKMWSRTVYRRHVMTQAYCEFCNGRLLKTVPPVAGELIITAAPLSMELAL